MKKELNINMNLISLLENANEENILDTIRILEVKYAIKNNKIAEIMKIGKSTLSIALKRGTFEGLFKENKMHVIAEGVQMLKEYYLL